MTNRLRNRISADAGAGPRGGAGTPVQIGTVLYVNSVTGNDSNNGFTPTLAKLTIANALTALPAGGGTIRITAPIGTPTNGFHTVSSGLVILEGTNRVPWYTERTTTFTTGWTADGGGVYHRANGGGDADIMFVTTQTDADGFQRLLLKNTSTPATPGAGEFGRDATNFYVRLFDSSDPNLQTIKRHNTGFLFRASGTVTLIIRDAIGRYSGSNGTFECNATGAMLILDTCIGIYSASTGVSLPITTGGTVICSNCIMQRHLNDGYNQQAGALTCYDCQASYNNDEGFAVHGGGSLTVQRGRAHHNQSAGYSAVNANTHMVLSDLTADFNGAKNQPGIERNGIVFDTGVQGSVTNCLAANNTGCGFYCNGATVTITNLTSGLAQGNTLADDPC
jgi:hypothetical protein